MPGRLQPGARSVTPVGAHERTSGRRLDDAKGGEFTTMLANLLRGQNLVVENVGALRLRVAREPEARGVEVECRRRACDGGRWWFVRGAAWMCEADSPVNAVVLVKAALATEGGR
ncbi:hypothetical protein GWI34_16210 [Actinomadura sp. DSM 109109]|nr:hypothetical protein [Actinomadura lepetitiana]